MIQPGAYPIHRTMFGSVRPKRLRAPGQPAATSISAVISPRFGANDAGRRLDPQKVKIISGRSNPALAQGIAESVGLSLTPTKISAYPTGQLAVSLDESVQSADVFIVQSTQQDAHTNIFETLLLMDAAIRDGAKSVTVVMPSYGYGRSDRRTDDPERPGEQKREAIGAVVVAKCLKANGVNRVITVDLHSPQTEAFFDDVKHLSVLGMVVDYLKKKDLSNALVVSPDLGGVKRAQRFSDALGLPLAPFHKKRGPNGEVEKVTLIGYTPEEIQGKTMIIVDDEIDTGGSIGAVANDLKKMGAAKVYVVASHPVFSKDAVEKLQNAKIDEVIVTDTLPLSAAAQKVPKITQLSMAPVIGDKIFDICRDAVLDPGQASKSWIA